MAKKKIINLFLRFWLILMIVTDSLATLFYLIGGKSVVYLVPMMTLWSVYSLGLISLINIILVILLLNWKKWAFFGFCGTSLIAFSINVSLGLGFFVSLIGLVANPIIIYLAMRPQWKLFN